MATQGLDRLTDAHDGLKRLRTLLDTLYAHEGKGHAPDADSQDAAMTIRFALLDAARQEVAMLVDETTIEGPWAAGTRQAKETPQIKPRPALVAVNGNGRLRNS